MRLIASATPFASFSSQFLYSWSFSIFSSFVRNCLGVSSHSHPAQFMVSPFRKAIGFPISVNRYLYLNLSIYRFSERYLYVGSTVCPMKPECEMKGFLSLLLLWIIHEKKMTGSGIANEISARKGSKPSPGTIYPALKDLKEKGLVSCDKGKVYSITKKGRLELSVLLKSFFSTFKDIDDMKRCCG